MTKKNTIHELLIDRLLTAHYAFGQPILVKEVVAETGISRQPVMTALSKLSAQGFVRIIPQVGCEVIDPSHDEIADFFLMFERMEGLLAELAAVRRTDRQVREIRMIQQHMQMRNIDTISSQEYCEVNRDFHNLIHVMARSPLLDERQRSNFNMSDFFINQTVGFNLFMKDALHEHDEIIDALDKGDSDRARQVSEKHIAAVRRAVLSGLPA